MPSARITQPLTATGGLVWRVYPVPLCCGTEKVGDPWSFDLRSQASSRKCWCREVSVMGPRRRPRSHLCHSSGRCSEVSPVNLRTFSRSQASGTSVLSQFIGNEAIPMTEWKFGQGEGCRRVTGPLHQEPAVVACTRRGSRASSREAAGTLRECHLGR